MLLCRATANDVVARDLSFLQVQKDGVQKTPSSGFLHMHLVRMRLPSQSSGRQKGESSLYGVSGAKGRWPRQCSLLRLLGVAYGRIGIKWPL